jgi:hypothetical protein
MKKQDLDGIDFDKLNGRLVEIENRQPIKPIKKYPCPCRGLTGDLAKKQSAEMAGCMHSGMTEQDREEIKRIQKEYDSRDNDKTTEGN